MEPDQEFREFAESLMSHGVKFMVIGGYAVTAHGHPRYTGDIDFFVEKSPENARRIVSAIHSSLSKTSRKTNWPPAAIRISVISSPWKNSAKSN